MIFPTDLVLSLKMMWTKQQHLRIEMEIMLTGFLKENNLEYTPVSAIAAMMLTFYIYNLYSYLSTVHLHYT